MRNPYSEVSFWRSFCQFGLDVSFICDNIFQPDKLFILAGLFIVGIAQRARAIDLQFADRVCFRDEISQNQEKEPLASCKIK